MQLQHAISKAVRGQTADVKGCACAPEAASDGHGWWRLTCALSLAAAQLQRPILEKGSELLRHQQGFFVLEKVLQLSSGTEILPFAAVLFEKHAEVVFDKWFTKLVVKVVDRLVGPCHGAHPTCNQLQFMQM